LKGKCSSSSTSALSSGEFLQIGAFTDTSCKDIYAYLYIKSGCNSINYNYPSSKSEMFNFLKNYFQPTTGSFIGANCTDKSKPTLNFGTDNSCSETQQLGGTSCQSVGAVGDGVQSIQMSCVSGGLSSGAKVGIAIGVILGIILVVVVIVVVVIMLRKRERSEYSPLMDGR